MVRRQGELFSKAPVAVHALDGKILTLVDASGFIFRAYHALPSLTTSRGIPTHAVLGFTRMLLKLLRERQPRYLALCFDRDSRAGRQAIDPHYKANRKALPTDLLTQFGSIRKVAEIFNIPIIEVSGWEADDVIATMVPRARSRGFQVEIVSGDKDLLQLLADDVHVFDPLKNKFITEKDVFTKYGVLPGQLHDYLALMGDTPDNIPKVPGMQRKVAVGLLKQFGSVTTMYQRLHEVLQLKTREMLQVHRQQLERSIQLVNFRHDLPIYVDVEALERKEIDYAQARLFFTELEFFKLLEEIPAPSFEPVRLDVQRIIDRPAIAEMAVALSKAQRISIAPAYEGDLHSASLLGLGVCAGDKLFYVDAEALGVDLLREVLKSVLQQEKLEVATQDAKALLHLVNSIGIDVIHPPTDIQLLSYLLNASKKEHALRDLAREHLRLELPVLLSGRVVGAITASQRATAFAAMAEAVDRLTDIFWKAMEGTKLTRLARELELPLMSVLAKMEAAGVSIDCKVLSDVSVQADTMCKSLLQEIFKYAGKAFNVSSPSQLAQVLFEELNLPVLKKTKTGSSTDHTVLEKLANLHPLPRVIIEYRNIAKLKNSYLNTLPQLIDAKGRIHTVFHQTTAATGRLSSTHPNLQNIPIRTELGQQIRRAFIAERGRLLVSADYSQIELRILAHFSDDVGLVNAFLEDKDVHLRTAAEVFGVPLRAVTKEQRRTAKMINYGIAYGLSAHGLATRLHIAIDAAQSIVDRYYERFPGIARYMTETVDKAKRLGYVESLFGRRRYLPDLSSHNRVVAMAAERAAINMPIQGTAADLVKQAMLDIDKALSVKRLASRMLLQVHDELLFEAPEFEAPTLAELAKSIMSQVTQLKVPLLVDVGIGHSWASAH